MKRNARVSLAVILSAGGLILLLALALALYWALTCDGGAHPGTGEKGSATPADTNGENQTLEHRLRQELQSSAANLERAHQELGAFRNQTDILKGTLAKRLQELLSLQQKVSNLSSENQRLQEDLLSWRKNLSSTSEELREAKSIQEELQRQNKEYQVRVQQMESLLHNGSGHPKSARLFGMETLMVLLSLIFWVY